MSYQVTQEDLDILRQGMQEITVKVDLLDTNYKILDSLEGNVITDSISQDNESVQRRSYSCTLQITHSSLLVKTKRFGMTNASVLTMGLSR